MGRFQSTVEFYARYREPYSPNFFATVAQQLTLHGNESLVDVASGPGLLAIGFAPYVGRITGVDPEPGMIHAAHQAAVESGVSLTLVQSTIEDFVSSERFQLITIGRALHWLDRTSALPRLEQLAAPGATLLVCSASSIATANSLWVRTYNQVRHAYANESEESRYRLDARAWFAESRFHHRIDISVNEGRSITIDGLIRRALSRSNTSPEVLGDRRGAFETEIREALKPFSHQGKLQEEITACASVFQFAL